MRGESLGTRLPPTSAVSPLSPRRVYTRVMLIVMADLRCGILLDVKTRARAVLATASGTHFVHDGFSDILYVLLPVWAQEFGLNLAQVGLIRTAYTAAMASFQIPAGLLAERWGERRLLAAGTALTTCGFIAAGAWAGGFASLLVLPLLAGLGSGVQHPLSSSLVSKAYETGARRAALGTYNFSGDLGKVAVPAAVAFAATVVGWRAAAAGYGVFGLAAALAIVLLLARLATGGASEPVPRAPGYAANGWGIRDARGFQALSAIGMIDNATRTRSEEHTSELQSPCNLVCRLLLEKKKKTHKLKDSRATRQHAGSH